MEALGGAESIAAICRKHDIAESMFHKWNKEIMEVGKKRLAGDTTRGATSDEVRMWQTNYTYFKILGWGII